MLRLNKEWKTKLDIFRNDRRAYYSFLILAFLFFISLPAELICNIRPILLVVDGKSYFPIVITYSEKDFGGVLPSEPDYKSKNFINLLSGIESSSIYTEEKGLGLDLGDFEDEEDESTPVIQNQPEPTNNSPREYSMFWPPVRYDYKYIPTESTTGNVVLAAPYPTETHDGDGFHPSSWEDGHYLGTDDRGRDVLARLVYGFRISMLFGVSLAITGTLIGCLIGGTQGFFGGWVDLSGQRITEIWGSIPRLYILIILSSFLVPSALLLFLILNLTAWMGIAAYIRAEFLKIRNYEFVKAAKSLGVSNFTIMRRHILPNALTPVVTFFPFEVTAGILALVSLDFLNLGVPSPAPSLGELLAQGKNNLHAIWILLPTFITLSLTITLLTFVGEGIRNAFDPRKTL
ncbi:ABC transporter permease [Nitrospinae bacterium]|nr:ABC transporter permease [Nitrospinota bacterium]|tara:strand:- start:1330 stop:2538 length:1209 start_codon:yes stop_codon:yes gene_type:complete